MCGRVKQLIVLNTALLLLVLGGCAQRTEPAPVTRLYKGKTIHDFEPASLSAASYIVEQGDTLYSIAFRANEDVRTLARWNNIDAPYTIVPGQKLRLTATTSRTAPVKPKAQSQTVASAPKKEYREQQVKQNKSKPLTVKQQNKPARTLPPRKTEPPLPASKDIIWQWPTGGRVLKEFSTAETGTKGLDIAGSRGDPIYAAAAGKVVYAGNALKGYGQLIILKHNDDYITAYAHNQQLLVKEQQWVNKGDEIAAMGDTDAERVKLHFQVRFRGKSVNPRHYLPRGTQ
ncbi:peptidoglycan DD-metalloendopeptidase family protein [Pseudidiomarina andamanensis]|uniref:LysM peptidoglycan-binding domain-containing protein n=2 Tax=Bacteria TaxID=2 RepID=A0AA92ILS8_9GAMM|nr:peptidoglycan DD-metalloendopeptidase family protein [Pseudidiomarina andamanensis]ADI48580.1 putative lipoprotein NlpD [uncultured bacterium fss6]MDS0218231.1 peptidoglycan DD-metalloendopeptidase family protein [Pseudidiomarina andamanensis]QGT95117.1 LysM peptidoglycan-binding domain-containing protein [Pseudidiomarina andamanensis]